MDYPGGRGGWWVVGGGVKTPLKDQPRSAAELTTAPQLRRLAPFLLLFIPKGDRIFRPRCRGGGSDFFFFFFKTAEEMGKSRRPLTSLRSTLPPLISRLAAIQRSGATRLSPRGGGTGMFVCFIIFLIYQRDPDPGEIYKKQKTQPG